MIGPNFTLRGRRRRIARAIVDAMVPRWPEFPHDLTEPVLASLEAMIQAYPPALQAGFTAALFGLEYLSPAAGGGLRPLSRCDRATRLARLEALADHRLPQVRQGVLLFKILISMSAYSRPEVEAFLGYRRREWRDARRKFRDALVAEDPAQLPATPAALGAVVSPADYLAFAPPAIEPAIEAATETGTP